MTYFPHPTIVFFQISSSLLKKNIQKEWKYSITISLPQTMVTFQYYMYKKKWAITTSSRIISTFDTNNAQKHIQFDTKKKSNTIRLLSYPNNKKSGQALKNMNSASVVNKIHFATKIHFNYQVAKQKNRRQIRTHDRGRVKYWHLEPISEKHTY